MILLHLGVKPANQNIVAKKILSGTATKKVSINAVALVKVFLNQ